MKRKPGIESVIFEDEAGWWRIRDRQDTSGMSRDEVAAWLADLMEESVPAPRLSTLRFDTDHEARIAVLEDYIADFVDEYHPQLTVKVVDPDDDAYQLEQLRIEARNIGRLENRS